MATATAKPKVKKGAEAKAAPATKAPAKEKPAKSTAEFTLTEVWDTGKEYSKSARAGMKDYAAAIAEMQGKADADPKAYRDHVAAIKFQQRRVDRITLSLDELDQGMKERAPRAVKPKPETTPKAKATKGKKVEEPEDEDEDDDEEDEDDDEEEDDEDLD